MSNSTALATVDGSALAHREDVLRQEQLELLRKTIASSAPQLEFDLFVATCNRLRLDPFARQIYLVPRFEDGQKVWKHQVSIDGFRLIAERTGQYRGQTAIEWCGKDGRWVDAWLCPDLPAAARVGVYRAGFAAPLVRVARFASYAQTTRDGNLNKTWRTMPDVMIAKCAEALALRAAFPYELGGVYTLDELPEVEPIEVDQATGEVKPAAAAPKSRAPKTADRALPSDAEGWRAAHNKLCDELFEASGIVAGAADEYGLFTPTLPVPSFSPQAKMHAGKRYDDKEGGVKPGTLREIFWKKAAFWKDASAPQALWVSYLVARHQIAKLEDEAAEAALGKAGAA